MSGILVCALALTIVGPSSAFGYAGTRAVGSNIWSDGYSAGHVVRNGWEPVPANYAANHRVPTAAELARFRATYYGPCQASHWSKVTGNFTGTTDEIIQWASYKWGVDENIVRAIAVNESHWRMSAIGDQGRSFGVLQIKRTAQPGTYPLSAQSTAFNLDFAVGTIRQHFDGCTTWLRNGYRAGDIWGSVGVWFSGTWYNDQTRRYIALIQKLYNTRAWTWQL
jgi:hypothetical protein